MADGERIPINEMGTNHLRNAINVMNRRKLDALLKKEDVAERSLRFVNKFIAEMQKELDSRPMYELAEPPIIAPSNFFK